MYYSWARWAGLQCLHLAHWPTRPALMLPYGVTRPQCVKFPHFTGPTWPPCQERHLPHWIQLCLTPSCSSQETRWAGMDCYWPGKLPGIILCIRPAIGRQRCNVTSSLIGWAYTQHDPWFTSNLASNILGLTPGLGSIPELELELMPIPIPGIGIEKELNKRNWNWNW